MLDKLRCIKHIMVTVAMLIVLYIALIGITVNNLIEDVYLYIYIYIFNRNEFKKKYGV